MLQAKTCCYSQTSLEKLMKKHSGSVEGLLTLLKPSFESHFLVTKIWRTSVRCLEWSLFLEDFTSPTNAMLPFRLWKDYLVFALFLFRYSQRACVRT